MTKDAVSNEQIDAIGYALMDATSGERDIIRAHLAPIIAQAEARGYERAKREDIHTCNAVQGTFYASPLQYQPGTCAIAEVERRILASLKEPKA